MVATIQYGQMIMLKTITYGSIVLTLLFLSGCWYMSLPSYQQEVFTTRTKEIKSLLGSTSEELIKIFGHPKWIAHEDNATAIKQGTDPT